MTGHRMHLPGARAVTAAVIALALTLALALAARFNWGRALGDVLPGWPWW